MKKEAMRLGCRLVDLEQELDRRFARRAITQAALHDLLEKISVVRRKLRYVHLAVHLEPPAILSSQQIELYSKLKGYSSCEDACSQVPTAHDAALWRRHHHCD